MAKYTKKYTTTSESEPDRFWLWLAIGAVGGIIVVILLFVFNNPGTNEPVAGASGSLPDVTIFPDPGAGHVEGDIEYAYDAPPGGPHNAVWQNCGIYDEPVRSENAVHSLEHGAVWIAYQPDIPAEQIEYLRNLVRQEAQRRGPLIVLAPKPDLDDPIVITAWRAQLRLQDTTDEQLAIFVSRYQKGPFTPELNATCQGGIGEPL